MNCDEIQSRDLAVAEHIAKVYARALTVADDLRAVGWAMFSDWDGRGLEEGTVDVLVAAEGARSAKTYAAVVHLLRGGYGEQAAMLHRALFEGMAVAHWVTVEPGTALQRFTQHAQHNRLLWGDALRNAGWLDGDEGPGVGDDRDDDKRKDLDDLFAPYGERGWTGCGLHALVGKVAHMWGENGQQLWQHYRIAHRASNQILHATHDALLGSVAADEERQALVFEHAPSPRFIGRGLFETYWTHLQTLTLVRDHFELKACEAELRRLTQVPSTAFKRAADEPSP